ncbi:MAG: porin family protein [Ignavibacteria bacterium]
MPSLNTSKHKVIPKGDGILDLKSVYTAISLFMILNLSVYSQPVLIGGTAGFNLSKLDYSSSIITDNYIDGFHYGIKAGIFIEYPLSDMFFVCSEINYSMRGTELKSKGIFIPPDRKLIIKMDYIEIPLIFQLKLPINSFINPKVFIGPEVSFLLEAKEEIYINEVKTNEVKANGVASEEFGIVLGAGLEYNFLFSKIIFDLRYYYGLSSIYQSSTSVFSNTISFNIGFGFSIIKNIEN